MGGAPGEVIRGRFSRGREGRFSGVCGRRPKEFYWKGRPSDMRGLTTLAPEPTFVNTGVKYGPLLTCFS
ncbi:hypothetical protein GCM10018780_18150 [Streptomyces lanatus]|nr:hypothetical protein GCM10018780_18150 [Streptomyces lanatus]